MYYMLTKFNDVMRGLLIYPENMKNNINITCGLIFSQRVLLLLVQKGLTREQAYKIVQDNAMKVWQGEGNLKDLLKHDLLVSKFVSSSELDTCFDMNFYLKNVAKIYKRLKI